MNTGMQTLHAKDGELFVYETLKVNQAFNFYTF